MTDRPHGGGEPVPDQARGPGQDDEQTAASASGQPYLDYQALLEALAAGGFLDGSEEDRDAAAAAEQEAAEDGRMSAPLPAWQTGALAVEHMPPGPAQAGWLAAAAAQAGRLDEYGLAGVAIAARRLASWATAVELGAVGQITARAAAADPDIGLKPDGRPTRLCRDALGQVSLALRLTDHSATAWADLAITLTWRLPATGAALADGRIDLARARMIAEATSVLSQDAARVVEAEVLPGAGQQTTARLRARLRRAVIAADPEGAEQRRQEAERHAAVSLYGDDDGTATLTGSGLPAVEAAAAMARITAIARALKAAGHGGGLDLHRAQVMLGLLLGTLPYIPPPGGTPEPPPPGDPDPGGCGGDGPGDGPDEDGPDGDGPGRPRGGADSARPDDRPAPRDEDAPADDGLDEGTTAGDSLDSGGGDRDRDDWPGAGPVPPWPALGVVPPALVRPDQPIGGRPPAGLLDVTVPWATLAGLSAAPGLLGRIGPITAGQARGLARTATTDPAAQWRIIITNPAGQALTVTRIPRRTRTRDGPASPRHHSPPGLGLVARITLTISQDTVREQTAAGPGPPGQITAATLKAAARALDRALAQAADDTAAGGCAHTAQSDDYRPPPRLRERVTARDVTCRHPACRQPAWRADLDHTIPYEHGGRTCACNLGGACRRHHQLKQHPRWHLDQTRPGEFTWTTPAGRAYAVGPDVHPL
jgi:hypothetical protein